MTDEAGHLLSHSDATGIAFLIDAANRGGSDGIACAWTLVDEMERLFSEQVENPQAAIGLAFSQALAEAWNEAFDVENPPGRSPCSGPRLKVRQLMPALKALGLAAERGRRESCSAPEAQRSAAWTAIEEAADAFGRASQLEQWLGDFLRALLKIRDAQGAMVDAQHLLPAFYILRLTAPAGRPSMENDEITSILAMEERERQKLASQRQDQRYQHGDAEAAREIVGKSIGIDPGRLAEVRKQHPDLVRIVSPNASKDQTGEGQGERTWLTKEELEALAFRGKSAE